MFLQTCQISPSSTFSNKRAKSTSISRFAVFDEIYICKNGKLARFPIYRTVATNTYSLLHARVIKEARRYARKQRRVIQAGASSRVAREEIDPSGVIIVLRNTIQGTSTVDPRRPLTR